MFFLLRIVHRGDAIIKIKSAPGRFFICTLLKKDLKYFNALLDRYSYFYNRGFSFQLLQLILRTIVLILQRNYGFGR